MDLTDARREWRLWGAAARQYRVLIERESIRSASTVLRLIAMPARAGCRTNTYCGLRARPTRGAHKKAANLSVGGRFFVSRSGLFLGAPARRIVLASILTVRYGRDLHAHFGLQVTLDSGFGGTLVRLAPDQRQFLTDLDVRVDHAQRQRGALVEAVTTEHRVPDDLTALLDRIEGGRAVV